MRKHTIALLGATLLVGVPACVNLDEDVVTGLTPGSYGTQAVFESLVKASYEPLRSFYAQERGFTVTEFGTDIFTKGADGSFKYINDYTTQLNPDAQYFRETWVDFYQAINTANAAIDQAPIVVMDSTLKARRLAEVRFLRALYYFDLVQMFGPLTLTLHETRTPTPSRRAPPSIRCTTRSSPISSTPKRPSPPCRRSTGERRREPRSTCSPRCT